MNIIERVYQILKFEAKAIENLVVNQSFVDAINSIIQAEGKILSTGMGKAGFVAKKFSALLSSTGTPSVYIHPGEASHGDIGLVEEGDILFVFSTSGKTREIIELIQLSNRLGLKKVISITSHKDAELRKFSDITIEMGIIEEPCYLGLTPSASSAVMSAIGDAICLVVMELKDFKKSDYAIRHHSGYLGERAKACE